MSQASHDQAADGEETEAVRHQAQYDPKARKNPKDCRIGKGRPCWSDEVNPTEEYARQAEKHREQATLHREASRALRDAEQKMCTGVSSEDRDISPFFHTADIESVVVLRRDSFVAESVSGSTPVGATITIAAVPGLTKEWLQRVIDCHLTRNAALGFDVPEMAYCPLALKDVKAVVRSAGPSFAVDISSGQSATADEILRRAQALAGS